MGIKNKINDIKSSVKLIGCVVVIFVMVAAMMLIARQYIIDQDSMYRQYIGSHQRNWRAEDQPRENTRGSLPPYCRALSTQ